jgi:DNA-binding IclR family transcriptional regulator
MNSTSSPAATPATVKSADRCLDLLELLAQHPDGLTLSEVCGRAGWPKSSALALLRTLERRGYVLLAANGSYLLGPRVTSLGSAYLDRISLAEEGLEAVRAVSRAVDETVHLAVLRGKEVLYVAKAEGGGQMRMVSAVGRMIPAHGPGVGKMLLASLPDDLLEEMFPPGEPLARLTAKTVTDREIFLRELARIRQQDYATDDGESTIGLRCIAAPVRRPRADRRRDERLRPRAALHRRPHPHAARCPRGGCPGALGPARLPGITSAAGSGTERAAGRSHRWLTPWRQRGREPVRTRRTSRP